MEDDTTYSSSVAGNIHTSDIYSVLVVSSLLFLINEQVKYFRERSLSAVRSYSG